MIIPPDDDRSETLRNLAWALLGIPPPLVFAGLVFTIPAFAVLYVAVPKILSGEISINLSGVLCVIIAVVMAWGGVAMIRLDSNRR